VTHEEYYRQFVTPGILYLVESRIGIDAVRASKDEHLNDIPLSKWDDMEPFARGIAWKLKEAGDGWSKSANVCIAKQAARMLIEGKAKE